MNRIKLIGYDLLGEQNSEGIRYAWQFQGCKHLLESAAFINKTKGKIENISGYTSSVSVGCILTKLGNQCKFCRTGNVLPFISFLTAEEIAKQNIFMVLADLYCSEHVSLVENQREFAYMGQGEPGFSYPQVRRAIKITDYVMSKLSQSVYRHVIATSGISEMLYALESDLQSNYFNSRITIHFSLHAFQQREAIMPIEIIYPYKTLVNELRALSEITREKICLGVLLFKNFRPLNSTKKFSTLLKDIDQILTIFDANHFRFSFCEFNNSEELGCAEEYNESEAKELLYYALAKGYEAKLFSSFGKKEKAACGMLAGKKPEREISNKWKELDHYAEKLIDEAVKNI